MRHRRQRLRKRARPDRRRRRGLQLWDRRGKGASEARTEHRGLKRRSCALHGRVLEYSSTVRRNPSRRIEVRCACAQKVMCPRMCAPEKSKPQVPVLHDKPHVPLFFLSLFIEYLIIIVILDQDLITHAGWCCDGSSTRARGKTTRAAALHSSTVP